MAVSVDDELFSVTLGNGRSVLFASVVFDGPPEARDAESIVKVDSGGRLVLSMGVGDGGLVTTFGDDGQAKQAASQTISPAFAQWCLKFHVRLVRLYTLVGWFDADESTHEAIWSAASGLGRRKAPVHVGSHDRAIDVALQAFREQSASE
jgi:hypothetical protein